MAGHSSTAGLPAARLHRLARTGWLRRQRYTHTSHHAVPTKNHQQSNGSMHTRHAHDGTDITAADCRRPLHSQLGLTGGQPCHNNNNNNHAYGCDMPQAARRPSPPGSNPSRAASQPHMHCCQLAPQPSHAAQAALCLNYTHCGFLVLAYQPLAQLLVAEHYSSSRGCCRQQRPQRLC